MAKFKELSVDSYDVFLFDLDGLILDSLPLLTDAIVESVSSYTNRDTFEEFNQYSKAHPGVSRFEKFSYFFDNIETGHEKEKGMQSALQNFERLAFNARLTARISDGILPLIEKIKLKKIYLSTNCSFTSLPKVLQHHNLDVVFNSNAFGTPPHKNEHARKISAENQYSSILSISDSSPDATCAKENGFDFLFIEEFAVDQGEWVTEKDFKLKSLISLLEM